MIKQQIISYSVGNEIVVISGAFCENCTFVIGTTKSFVLLKVLATESIKSIQSQSRFIDTAPDGLRSTTTNFNSQQSRPLLNDRKRTRGAYAETKSELRYMLLKFAQKKQ